MSELREVWKIIVDSGYNAEPATQNYYHEPTKDDITEFCKKIDVDTASITVIKRYIFKR